MGIVNSVNATQAGVQYQHASGIWNGVATSTANQILLSGSSTTPTWSTSTYPSTNAVNTLLYASSANTMAALATANNSVVATNGSGVPSLTTSLPAAVQVGVNSLNSGTSASSSTFWRGDGSWSTPSGGSVTIAGDSGSVTGLSFTLTGGTTGLTFSGSSTTLTMAGTAIVGNGGTGRASQTAYMPILGGTTTTAAQQSVAVGSAAAGWVLTYVSSSAVPTWQPGASVLNYTAKTNGTYAVLSTDQFISVDSSGGAATIQLPNSATTGQVFYVKDRLGQATTNSITITTVGGSVTIDGATNYILSLNYQNVGVIFDGSNYQVL